ncbi:MAG: hypothetical protein HDKAJFGB_02319 [Anaerolineae bacterium]|nr:hypothetical protein [Anaerolineae bacterium]
MRPRLSWITGISGPMDRNFYEVEVLEERIHREWLLRRGEKHEREFVPPEMD